MIEVELKAVVRDGDALRAALEQRAPAQRVTYADRYFDYSDHQLTEQERELRVRTITDSTGRSRVLLTYKEPVPGAEGGAKREYETTAGDAEVVVSVLTALGVAEFLAFQKHCVNYRFTALGRDLLATVVTVPELAGQTFLELETMADAEEVDAAWGVVRCVLRELGISEHDLTTVTYTDAVAAQRSR